jgi:phage terminase Nu1 subunit (DNA packaging protein)
MNKQEAAARLGYSTRTVDRFVEDGLLTRGGTPRKALFDPDEVEELRRRLFAGDLVPGNRRGCRPVNR